MSSSIKHFDWSMRNTVMHPPNDAPHAAFPEALATQRTRVFGCLPVHNVSLCLVVACLPFGFSELFQEIASLPSALATYATVLLHNYAWQLQNIKFLSLKCQYKYDNLLTYIIICYSIYCILFIATQQVLMTYHQSSAYVFCLLFTLLCRAT